MTIRHRPGILAVRTINQYRRRDVLTYLALRYYLDNTAACTDHWAREVATGLVLTRSSPTYFRAHHFKALSPRHEIDHRQMFLPGANEAIAEAALLDECSKYPLVFGNLPCVFSYELNYGNDRSGVFKHYSKGLRNRHEAISKACDEAPEGEIHYIDLKKFYPSISLANALEVWRQAANSAGLTPIWRELGDKLLSDHGSNCPDNPSILTGPMFSHLIANLVLRPLDVEFSASSKVRYFRYVDDITLVGSKEHVDRTLVDIRARVNALGLDVHDESSPKNLRISTREWLTGRHDFSDSRRPISWMTFVGDMKRYLLTNPGDRSILQKTFTDAGLRIPIQDYSTAIYERSYLEQIAKWAELNWFRKKVQSVSVDSLVKQALWLRSSYQCDFESLSDGFGKLSAYERKRRIPKLRYRAGRLSYLATEESLVNLSKHLEGIEDLYLHSVIMATVASGDINSLLPLGTNAAQAAAQPMRAGNKSAFRQSRAITDAESQALAIFHLNGVKMEPVLNMGGTESPMLSFAELGANKSLMRSSDSFISELSSLHGLSECPRHAKTLESVFDEDEQLALDAVDQLGQSPSA